MNGNRIRERRCSSAGETDAQHKLIKRMSAVSFKDDNIVVYHDNTEPITRNVGWIKDPVEVKRESESEGEKPVKKTKHFKTILKKTMPKLQSIRVFNTLHESAADTYLEPHKENDDTIEVANLTGVEGVDKTGGIVGALLKESVPVNVKKRKSFKKCKSLSSIRSNSSTQLMGRPELVNSFIRRSSSKSADISRKKDHENGRKREVKSAKADIGSKGKKKNRRHCMEPIFINTRLQHHGPDDTPFVSEAAIECSKIHEKLQNYGVSISLATLRRALLPPNETRVEIYEVNQVRLPDRTNNGLLSHPSIWLPREYNRLRAAKKRMDEFDEEFIRRSMVVTSDDDEAESDTSCNGSNDKTFRTSATRVSLYHSFARKSKSGTGLRQSAPPSAANRNKKKSVLTKASTIYKICDSKRPSTAGI